jgi:putative glutamine amidotransferase
MCTTSDWKPVVGITTWRRDFPTFLGEKTDLYTLGSEYIEWVEQAGGIPVMFPHSLSHVDKYLDMIDVLLMSGGGDIDPVHYGQQNEGLSYEINPDADRFEISLLREAARRKKPTFGICRGFQIMQVAFGGDMLQDLHAQYPDHPRITGSPEHILSLRHKVRFLPDSFIARAYGGPELEVNTIHHQCVRTLGRGFKASAWSEDGIIEAAESESDWLAMGVQWHPEKIADMELFRCFIQAVKDLRHKK